MPHHYRGSLEYQFVWVSGVGWLAGVGSLGGVGWLGVGLVVGRPNHLVTPNWSSVEFEMGCDKNKASSSPLKCGNEPGNTSNQENIKEKNPNPTVTIYNVMHVI